jgi:predicted peptidase
MNTQSLIMLTVSIMLTADSAAVAAAPRGGEMLADSVQLQAASPLKYWLYLPENYDRDERARFPLLLFLHGGGEGGDDLERVKKHGPPKLIAAGRDFPFLMLAPQNPSETQFWDDQQLSRLLDDVESRYRVDADRVYLTGLSRGAFGAWRLAMQHPRRFAALVTVCGGGYAPYAKRLSHLPVWVFHGARDATVEPEESQRMVAALRKAGGDVRLTVYPDAEHDSWTVTYENPELYRWLLAQRRKAHTE